MSIQLSNVAFYYPNAPEKLVLKIDDWATKQGEKCFMHGPSGCGKSTLLNLISGLYQPTTGAITVLGERLDKMTVHQRDKFRANNIGYIFQQFNLIPYLNAIENIQLASYFSNQKLTRNLRLEISELLETLKVSVDDWTRPVEQLSFGQQQRVGIARALINRPKLLIADEPTSALDFDARDAFLNLLTQLTEEYETTLLFVSHDTQLQRHFDSVLALSTINKSVAAL